MSDPAQKIPIRLPSRTLDLFAPYEHFCKVLLDAYVLVDENGKIIKCNAMFNQIAGQNSRQILKTGILSDVITFELNDNEWGIADILSPRVPTRIDEVRGRSLQNPDLNLIIGIYPLLDPEDSHKHCGAFVLIRDVTAETALQGKYKDSAIRSITDPLTGLFTRAYFDDYLNLQVKNLSSTPRTQDIPSVCLVIIDIDFFKKVNDGFGHQAGDYVLKVVASLMKKTFRKADINCRYGGEEFLVILPGTDVEGAVVAVEKLRQAVAAEVITFENRQIPITISAGVAEILFGKEDYMNTIARADKALYECKHTGRNKVLLHNGTKIAAGSAV